MRCVEGQFSHISVAGFETEKPTTPYTPDKVMLQKRMTVLDVYSVVPAWIKAVSTELELINAKNNSVLVELLPLLLQVHCHFA